MVIVKISTAIINKLVIVKDQGVCLMISIPGSQLSFAKLVMMSYVVHIQLVDRNNMKFSTFEQ